MNDKIPFSHRTLDILIKAWKAGKAALTILLIGTICFIAAFTLALKDNQAAGFVFMALGAMMVAFVGYQFYFEAIVPARVAANRMQENPEVLNLVQDATLQLTSIIIDLNDYSLMNAKRIVDAIQAARRVLNTLPFGVGTAAREYLDKPDEFAKKIREMAESSRTIVADMGDSIKRSDFTRIKKHLEDLKGLKATIERELALGR